MFSSPNFQVQVELKSVNGRYFELRPKLPRAVFAHESKIRELVASKIRRGMVDILIVLQKRGESNRNLIDRNVVTAYVNEAKTLAKDLGVSGDFNILGFLKLPGAISSDESFGPEQEKEILDLCIQGVQGALVELQQMRSLEGAKLVTVVKRDIDTFLELLAKLKALQGTSAQFLKERLGERIAKSLKEHSLHLDQNRLAQELAYYVDRSDINEELDRLKSHCEQFEGALRVSSGDPVGKRCDFLLQEIAREINTVGAKVDHADISKLVIELKLITERIREQVQNLE